jgi:hypothetical protein
MPQKSLGKLTWHFVLLVYYTVNVTEFWEVIIKASFFHKYLFIFCRYVLPRRGVKKFIRTYRTRFLSFCRGFEKKKWSESCGTAEETRRTTSDPT